MKRVIQSAVAMVLVTSGLALAQHRVDLSGANDANNQIGSGGRNIPSERPKAWQFAESIVNGTITGGKQFRGPTASGDPFAFRGNSGLSNMDRFIRDSAGISTSGKTSYNANQTHAYYGDSRATNAPDGNEQIPGGGGYIPPKPTGWRNVDPRVGSINDSTTYVYRPDLYGGAGAIDSQAVPSAISVPGVIKASRLDAVGLSDYTTLNRDLSSQFSGAQLQQIQTEIGNKTGTQFQNGNTQTVPNTDRLINKPIDDSVNDSVKPVQLGNTLDPNINSQLGTKNTLVTAASEQSSTYAQLAGKRAEQQQMRLGQANEEAAAKFNQAIQEAQQKEGAKPGNDQPLPRTGANDVKPGNVDVPMIKPSDVKKPDLAPARIGSMADDKKSSSNELIKLAEAQMREGKFSSAIDTFDQASKMAPKNLLIPLGRAHAELGGGFYRMAEIHLKQILTFDNTLLSGQYDLKAYMGEERLQIIERDLKEMLQKNEKDAGPAILQAYVYYNTSNERRAAALLEIANKRTDGKDPFVKLLKDNWTLPSLGSDTNK